MNIQLFSDLHLELEGYEPDFTGADVVVFAGDIHERTHGLDWMLSLKSSAPLLYVLGNHEHYKTSYPSLVEKLRRRAAGSAVHILQDDAVVIDGISFHGTTLWTDFALMGDPAHAGSNCQEIMQDFRYIRRLPTHSKMRAIDLSAIHRRSLAWLGESLTASTTNQNVVITHHAPSVISVAEQHRSEVVKSAYASKLDGFIAEHKPNLWLHGHLHNSSDYEVHGCRVVCNPRGYAPEELNVDFNHSLHIQLPS